MGSTAERFTCAIIGAGALPVRCAERLRQRGQRVVAVASSDASVTRWGAEHGAFVARDVDPASALFAAPPFDYLFSIVNESVLEEPVLRLARRGAINYEDGLLPHGAGMYATSWAIINRETSHVVTWRILAPRVDTGDVLVQRRVGIAEDDTAFSLNARCDEAALEAFDELIQALSGGRIEPIPQTFEHRAVDGHSRCPPGGGILDWRHDAHVLAALVRGLDFGPNPNALGIPKVWCGRAFLAIAAIEITARASTAPPGTVMQVSDEGVTVATGSHDVLVRQWRTLEGGDLSVAELASFDVRRGRVLDAPDRATAARAVSLMSELARHEAVWVARLAALEPMMLPYESSHATSPTSRSVRPVSLDIEGVGDLVAQALGGAGRCAEATVAAFLAYLGRLGGQAGGDVHFTDPRLQDTTDGLDGLFARWVPFRADPEVSAPLSAAVDAVRAAITARRTHGTYLRDMRQRYPRLNAVAESARGGRASLPIAVAIVSDLAVPPSDVASVFTLLVDAQTGGCRALYDAAHLDDEAARSLARHFLTFLRSMASTSRAGVAAGLSSLPVLDEVERRQLIGEWNATGASYPRDRTVSQLWHEQAVRTPEAPAATYGEETWTYRVLASRVTTLATRLRAIGVKPGVLVGIHVERSLHLLAAALAVLDAGGAYVPLDPGFPTERLAFMLEDAQAAVLVTERALVGRLPVGAASVMIVDEAEVADVECTESFGTNSAGSDDLAYVLYTSGSTGQPKGVEIPHRALTNFLWAMRREPGCTARDVVLAVTTLSFDIAALELYLPLITGAHVVLASRETAADGRALLAQLARVQPTILQATPATWRMLIEAGWTGTRGLTALCGGEALEPDLADALLERVTTLWNMYGPTETTIWSSVERITSSSDITIGRPIANTTFYIVDRAQQAVPVGVPGELLIGGDGLARGYHGRATLTAERFVPHPLASDSDARVYRTGDLARWRADGKVVHLGRLDHQVKLRGFRIELGEIETILARHPSVRQAVVVVREDQPGQARLVGYVQPAAAGAAVDVDVLRAHARASLPDYMVPAPMVVLTALPLTPNGKIDRKRLPAPVAVDAAETVAPRTETERRLAAIWADVLGVPSIGVHENFFELGGHSLLAMRLIDRIETELQAECSLGTLATAPTVATLAATIDGALPRADDALLAILAEIEGLSADRVHELLGGDSQDEQGG